MGLLRRESLDRRSRFSARRSRGGAQAAINPEVKNDPRRVVPCAIFSAAQDNCYQAAIVEIQGRRACDDHQDVIVRMDLRIPAIFPSA